jgi:ABC-type nitrate/sulfonate/bicarbonate transport system permease component
MIHASHRLRIYRHKRHHAVAIATLLIPLIILIVIGMISGTEFFRIIQALIVSVYRLAFGYGISLILGVGIAILLGTTKWGDSATPVLDVLQNIPSFALIPIFAAFMGFTDTMAITFIATSVIWPILFYVLTAIHTSRGDLGDAATIFGAIGWRRITHYLIPLSFPAIITGSIVAISIGWEAVIGIEIIGYHNGIGVLLNNASLAHHNSLLVAGIGVLLLLVFVINRLVWTPLIEKTHSYAE